MKIAQELNEYGTPVTRFRCETCGEEFTVCPAVTPDKEDQWTGCLAVTCGSYDPARDADKLFDESPELISREPVLPLNAKRR